MNDASLERSAAMASTHFGADKGYDVHDLIDLARQRGFTPHVTKNPRRRGGSALDVRTIAGLKTRGVRTSDNAVDAALTKVTQSKLAKVRHGKYFPTESLLKAAPAHQDDSQLARRRADIRRAIESARARGSLSPTSVPVAFTRSGRRRSPGTSR